MSICIYCVRWGEEGMPRGTKVLGWSVPRARAASRLSASSVVAPSATLSLSCNRHARVREEGGERGGEEGARRS